MKIMMGMEKLKKREVVLALLQILVALLISLNCAYIFSYRWRNMKRKRLIKKVRDENDSKMIHCFFFFN